MKIICVDEDGIENELTYGKWYNATTTGGELKRYVIINDEDIRVSYQCWRFKDISEVREEKLNKLGI
jgi:hypothetical protein